jgi:hypothetical protein
MGSEDEDFAELQTRIVAEIGAMEQTAVADAEEIYAQIVSPDDDPDIALFQLLLLSEKIKEKINYFSLMEFVELCNREAKSVAAWRQHSARRAAMEFVIAEWKKHGDAYSGNKSEFSRHYVKRVLNEHSVAVTEKQMREVWLKDTPSASTPAG